MHLRQQVQSDRVNAGLVSNINRQNHVPFKQNAFTNNTVLIVWWMPSITMSSIYFILANIEKKKKPSVSALSMNHVVQQVVCLFFFLIVKTKKCGLVFTKKSVIQIKSICILSSRRRFTLEVLLKVLKQAKHLCAFL